MARQDGFDDVGSRQEVFSDDQEITATRLNNLTVLTQATLKQLLLGGYYNAPGPAIVDGFDITLDSTGLGWTVSSGIAIRGRVPLAGGSNVEPPVIGRMIADIHEVVSADTIDLYYLIYATIDDSQYIQNVYDNINVRDPSTGAISVKSQIVRTFNSLLVPDGNSSHIGPYTTKEDALAAITDGDIPLAVIKVAANATGPEDIAIYDQRVFYMKSQLNGIFAAESNTGWLGTKFTRGILLSTNSEAANTNSAVLASTGSSVGGQESAAVASSGSSVTAAESAVIAADTSHAANTNTAIVAATSATASGATSAILASSDATSSGANSAVIASAASSQASGAKGLVAASDASTASNTEAVVLGSSSGTASGANSLLLASKNAELAEANLVGGGYSDTAITPNGTNQNITWAINTKTGGIGQATVSGYTSSNETTVNGMVGHIQHDLAGLAANDEVTITWHNSVLQDASVVILTMNRGSNTSANVHLITQLKVVDVGVAYINIMNLGPDAAASTDICEINFRITNPPNLL